MKQKLAATIKEMSNNDEYDCLLMFSGGKDSSYLLYYLSEVLKLNVATFTLSHKFLCEETQQNITNFAKKYSKKHITVENEYLNSAGTHFLENWINKPDEGSLITLCTGCRLGLIKLVIETAKKENINVIVTGLTPFEATDYRMKLVNYPKGKEGKLFFFLGYLRLVLRNPSLVKNLKVLKDQVKEFYYFSNQKKLYLKNNLHYVKPFYDFLKYDEELIVETLKRLNWQKAPISGNSFWRADCDMNAVRQYFHNKISGYNEQEYYYGQMLENKLISQEYFDKTVQGFNQTEGIRKILKISGISPKAIKKYEKFLEEEVQEEKA
ncbi:hypothetical protein [Saccharicrinis sp. GN24d3]|uniref:hypothetical protein n=1 Tax=Saccharicrinis sp. GN24d3 TaxID=3458416 RepID=UPI0040364136